MGAYLSRKLSACGCPEPRTGIRSPRGQLAQPWRSRVNVLSSRMARSRYFSRISSSVAGIPPTGVTSSPRSPLRCNSLPAAAAGDRPRHLSRAGRAAGGRGRGFRLQELQRLPLGVAQRRRLGGDVRAPERLQDLLRPVEVAHADPPRPEPLRDVRVRSGPADDPVLAGEADRLLVERRDGD